MRVSATYRSHSFAPRVPTWAVRLSMTLVATVLLLAPVASRQLTATRVAEGDNLQAVLDEARPGDTILLARGARFTGNFVLPAHPPGSTTFVTIRTDGEGLAGEGERTSPRLSGTLAVLQSPNNAPALRAAPGAHHWRIENVEFGPNRGGASNIIALGDTAERAREQVPHTIVLDRVYIHGDPEQGQKRAIALNSGSTQIVNSYISDIKAQGVDSQAIAGWNGPGPYLIENNYLEAAGENILFGGADPVIENLVPSDIVIRRNHITRPVSWRGSRWTIKNLLELKNARNVKIEQNLIEHNWAAAQAGYALLFKPENQDGGAPWTTIENVEFVDNVVRHVSGAININGADPDHPSARARGIVIRNNLFVDVSREQWGGTGDFLQIGGGPADVIVERNTVIHDGRVLNVYPGPASKTVDGLVFRGNVLRHNEYGVKGANTAVGRASLEEHAPGAVFEGNVVAGGQGSRYPRGNRFIGADEFDALFVGMDAGDFRLKDRVDATGVDVDALKGAFSASTSVPDEPATPRQSTD